MTSPTPPGPVRPPADSFSPEDTTEAALRPALRAAVTAWLASSRKAILSGGLVPNLSMMHTSGQFVTDAVRRVRDALTQAWLKVFARTGTDLRPSIDSYLATLPYRLDGLAPLANRRASKALAEKVASGDVEAMRKAVDEALADAEYDGYIDRVTQSEATISVNAARHDIAMTAWRAGADIDKTWTTRQDERVRHTHVRAEGQTVPFTAPFWVGGVPMQHPGDPTAPPSETANCRCRARYVIAGRR